MNIAYHKQLHLRSLIHILGHLHNLKPAQNPVVVGINQEMSRAQAKEL